MLGVKQFLLSNVSLLFTDILIFLICVGGVYHIVLKADLPFKISSENSNLFVAEIKFRVENINLNDQIITVDDNHFSKWEELELYLDGKNIGDTVILKLNSAGAIKSELVQLKNYYDLFDLIIISLVGLIFFVFGVFVRVKAPEKLPAHIFHWASVGLGMVIVMTAGYYNAHQFGYGHINRIMWLFVYSLTPVLFIHFASSFPKKKVKSIKYILWYFYVSAVINTIILTYLFINATVWDSFDSLKYYVAFFDSFFRIFLITCIIIAISICIYAYRSTDEIEERKRLQWLLLGFFIGPFSFVIFWVIPIFLTGYSLIPESLILIFLTAIPFTFSIAIIKYHLMDINLIIRRSVVYTIILAAIILTYVLISSAITLFVSDINPAFPSVLTALAVVVLLQPVKTGIQKFVDKKFFRIEYDFREEQKRFLNDIKNVYDIHSLAKLIVRRVDNLIPVEKIGFFELDNQTGRVKIIANKGWEILKGRSIRFEFENLKTDLSVPVAVDDKVEPGLKIESADVKVFKRWGMVLVFPIKSPSGIIHAFLVMGEKKAGTRYFKDDIDLLNIVSTTAALTFDRIKLQQELIIEHLETERLKELNEVKSLFVSSMVHELKRPLSGIKMFTELLHYKKDESGDSEKKYLSIIDGESEKLKHLINNILDNAMIEKGIKNYQLKRLEINSLVQKTVCEAEYLFKMKNQEIELNLLKQKVYFDGDAEAIESMLINLITNASKYSPEYTKTTVAMFVIENQIVIEIKDEGKGIAENELENIFQPYFRIKEKSSSMVDGTGLGLSIVKHVIDAHKGKIKVESTLGKGTKFIITLPALNN